MAGTKITKAEFDKMTLKFQKKNQGKTKAVIFDKDIIQELLNNPETKSVAIYFAENDGDKNTVALVGLNDSNSMTGDPVNAGGLCPPFCPEG
jgi:hypothetical protein